MRRSVRASRHRSLCADARPKWNGDPRQPGVDPVDWIERIPFDETRDYVQRVMENWRVYQARFRESAASSPASSAQFAGIEP